MKKITISLTIMLSSYLFAINGYDTNMDRVKYYDASRQQQEEYAKMAKELKKFISSTASQKLIEQYKNGKLKLSKEELLIQKQKNQNSNTPLQPAQQQATKQTQKDKSTQPTWYERLLEKIGIGSTKKLPQETKTDTNTTNAQVEQVSQIQDDTNTTNAQPIQTQEELSQQDDLEDLEEA